MTTKYYFFKTVREGGRNRLRALPGQTFPSGEVIRSDLNIQASHEMRESYPVGTAFVSDSLLFSGSYYRAGNIFPVGLSLHEYISGGHVPTEEASRAYKEFLGLGASISVFGTPAPEPVRESEAATEHDDEVLSPLEAFRRYGISDPSYRYDEKKFTFFDLGLDGGTLVASECAPVFVTPEKAVEVFGDALPNIDELDGLPRSFLDTIPLEGFLFRKTEKDIVVGDADEKTVLLGAPLDDDKTKVSVMQVNMFTTDSPKIITRESRCGYRVVPVKRVS